MLIPLKQVEVDELKLCVFPDQIAVTGQNFHANLKFNVPRTHERIELIEELERKGYISRIENLESLIIIKYTITQEAVDWIYEAFIKSEGVPDPEIEEDEQ